jgi:hypothetical protein
VPHRYSGGMKFEHMKTAIVGVWLLGLGAIALSINMSAAGGWTLFLGLGLLPALILLKMWHQPTPTMSESIRDVLR